MDKGEKGAGSGISKEKKGNSQTVEKKIEHTMAGKSLLENLETVRHRGNPANRSPVEFFL